MCTSAKTFGVDYLILNKETDSQDKGFGSKRK
jgi:hypothetical protein